MAHSVRKNYPFISQCIDQSTETVGTILRAQLLLHYRSLWLRSLMVLDQVKQLFYLVIVIAIVISCD